MRLTNEARVELRAKLKAAIAAAGESDTITPKMVNEAPKADLLLWAARFGVVSTAAASLAIDAGVDTVLEGEDMVTDEDRQTWAEPGRLTVDEALEALALQDVTELQRLVAVMDGQAFKAKALELARLAHKPAETITVEAVPVDGSAPKPRARKSGKGTLKDLFGVTGPLGRLPVDMWTGGTNVPSRDPHYVWTEDTGLILAASIVEGGNVMLTGPAGTGKTSFVEQVASVLGRPFFRISFHGQIEAAEIMGQRIITADQGMIWADGVLPMAMQVAGAIILLDEIDRARPGMVQALQSPLDSRKVTFPETGHTVTCAEGVTFFCAGNTNGTGDGTGQYTAAQQLDRATLDRMAQTVKVDYLPAAKEASLLAAKAGCNAPLASLLVHFAGVTRLDVAKGELPHGVGFRRLYALARMLVLGADPAAAINGSILNTVGPDEHEKLALLLKTHLSPMAIKRALKGEDVLAPAPAMGRGANDFTPIQE